MTNRTIYVLVAGVLSAAPSVAQDTNVLQATSATGPTYYVAPSGKDSNAGSANAPWATLHHAASALQPGTTVLVRGGIYVNDYFNVPAGAGTQAEPVTVAAYPGEVPMITGSGSYGTIMSIEAPTVINGITFFRPDANDVVDIWSNYVTVENCTFQETNGQFVRINGTSYITIQNNVFDTNGYIDTDGENDAIAMLGASNVLIQNNFATRNGHYFADAIYLAGFGPSKNIVIRDNTVQQHWGGGIGETGQGASNMLLEENRISNVGEGVAYIKTNFELNASNNIVRNNVLTNEAGWYSDNGLVLTGQLNVVDSSSEYNRIYNNVFYNIGYVPVFLSQREDDSHSPPVFNYVTNNKFVNNIFYQDEIQGTTFSGSGSTVYISCETYHSPNKTWPFYPYYNYFLNNLVGDQPGNNDLFQYTTATYTDAWNLTAVEGQYGSYVSGNIQANPEFADASTGDFRLAASSPAIAKGAHLTQTTAVGTSTAVPVSDPYFFTNGFGVVPGDSVKIGSNSPLTVTAVNYAGGVLTVSSQVKFNKGDFVDLAGFSASAPDVGAFAYSSAAPEAYNVSAVMENATSASISWTTSAASTGQVEYGTTTAYSQTSVVNTQAATSHTVVLAGLKPGTAYHYATISAEGSGARVVSADQTFTTPKLTGPLVESPAIGKTALTGAGTSATASVIITWSTSEPSSSQVLYSSGLWHRTYFNASPITNTSGVTSHSVTLTGLVPHATYHYAVQSTDTSGRTTYSADQTFTTPAITAPGPVLSQITATLSSGAKGWFAAPSGQGFAPSGKTCCGYSFSQATIAWKSNESVTKNEVLLTPVSLGGSVDTVALNNSTAFAVSGNPAATTSPSLTIYQLAPDTTYEYRVQSTDSSGHTTTSPSAEFTTPAVNY